MSNRCYDDSKHSIKPLLTLVKSGEIVLPNIRDWFEVL
jgi:hypothetical protein